MKQAEIQLGAADGTVTARIPEVYQWLLVPVQKSPQAVTIDLQSIRLASGHDALAVRVCKKLRNDELLLTGFAGTLLRMELDRVPLWRGNHVASSSLPRISPAILIFPGSRSPRFWLERFATVSRC